VGGSKVADLFTFFESLNETADRCFLRSDRLIRIWLFFSDSIITDQVSTYLGSQLVPCPFSGGGPFIDSVFNDTGSSGGMILCVDGLPTAIDPTESRRLVSTAVMVSTAVDARYFAKKPFTGSNWFNSYLICGKIFLTDPHLTASVSHVTGD